MIEAKSVKPQRSRRCTSLHVMSDLAVSHERAESLMQADGHGLGSGEICLFQ